MIRRTRIIATVGPQSESASQIEKLIKSGVNCFRINLSHGIEDKYTKQIQTIQKVREKLNKNVAIMVDTRGPEIRVKEFENGSVNLKRGQSFYFTSKDIIGNHDGVSITQPIVVSNAKVGKIVLANDGKIKLKIVAKQKDKLVCKVTSGGALSNNKSLCFAGQYFPFEYLNQKDMYDLEKTIKLGVDYVSASFVNSKHDIIHLKNFCSQFDANLKYISKIESQKGIDNIDEILSESDGIMVARGDLGVEINFDMLPTCQRYLINKARANHKLCVVATEMLESMIKENRPTRAEISDVSLAVFEGANCVMLSGETAVGHNPVLCVKAMSQIIKSAEKSLNYKKRFEEEEKNPISCNDLILQSGVSAGFYLKCKAIVTFTSKGTSARKLCTSTSNVPIVAITDSKKTYNQMAMFSNSIAVYDKTVKDIFGYASMCVKNLKIAKSGDLIIVTTGTSDKIDNVLKFEIIK